MVAAGTAAEAGSTYDCYTDLQNSVTFFNDSEEILTRIQNRTKNDALYEVLDEIIPAIKDERELKRQQIQQTIQNGTEEFLYETAHTVVSWCGSVGAAIEASIALGTLTGIPETAQYTYQTCCAASMADCLAAEWKDDITSKMAIIMLMKVSAAFLHLILLTIRDMSQVCHLKKQKQAVKE